MTQESVVYGCIKDVVFTSNMDQTRQRRQTNRRVLSSLPSIEDWPLIGREMFVLPSDNLIVDDLHTDVVPFGNSYKGVEYEWQQWLQRFEDLLQNMYWVSATVHLETELSGKHTFTWQSDREYHTPNSGPLSMRCEWVREESMF